MKLKSLPKEKRNSLILVGLLTAGASTALALGLIRPQYQHIAGLAKKRAAAQVTLAQMKEASKHADEVQAQAAQAQQTVAQAEQGLASGDLYDWVINTLRQFKARYQVDILQFGPISPPGPVNLLPAFPYQQATLSIVGTACFHDLGLFLADFENAFPDMRVVNLALEPTASAGPEPTEKLAFRIDLITLIKSNPS